MPKANMNDLIVLLPGITGSVLQRDEKDVWNISRVAICKALSSLGGSVKNLRLAPEDPTSDLPLAPDGVRATALISDAHIIPGLWKLVDGYHRLPKMLNLAFNLKECSHDDDKAGNIVRFPYDWRRDLRITSRILKSTVERKLELWRKHSNNDQARAILIGHSMGGVIAQYYLECLEGWRDARALITFGTPFRGAVQALKYLVNGYKIKKLNQTLLDLTDTMQSFPSVYQLLPRYAMTSDAGLVKRLTEVSDDLGLLPDLLEASTELHRDLDFAAEKHKASEEYQNDGYIVIPVVGINQPTLQSASRTPTGWMIGQEPFHGLDVSIADGDGTVPRVSAIPISQSDPKSFHGYFVAEQHGALQSHEFVLGDLIARIQQLQVGNRVGAIQGGVPAKEPKPLSIWVDDLFLPGEPVVIRGRSADDSRNSPRMQARITQIDGGEKITLPLSETVDGWSQGMLSDLSIGLYRIEIHADRMGAYRPVHSLFEVAPKE